MSKYVVLSFDDGRLDTYTRAIPIMERYNLTATINITTDFIQNPKRYTKFASSGDKPMTVDMIRDAENKDYEIAGHSHTHCNDIEDIKKGIYLLKEWKIKNKKIGFASPHSYVCATNFNSISKLIKDGQIYYLRSGIQVRREGYLYICAYILQEMFKSKFLFYYLNRKQIFPVNKIKDFYLGVSITNKTTVSQVEYLIEHMPDNTCVIFIMHSVLKKDDEGYGADKWYYDVEDFESLCALLSSRKDIKVVTNRKLRDGFNV